MRRHTPRYFVTARWVFDKAARRRERRACDGIAGAYDHIMKTADYEHGIDMDRASFDAIMLLDRLRKLVTSECDAAQRAAKHKESR